MTCDETFNHRTMFIAANTMLPAGNTIDRGKT